MTLDELLQNNKTILIDGQEVKTRGLPLGRILKACTVVTLDGVVFKDRFNALPRRAGGLAREAVKMPD